MYSRTSILVKSSAKEKETKSVNQKTELHVIDVPHKNRQHYSQRMR